MDGQAFVARDEGLANRSTNDRSPAQYAASEVESLEMESFPAAGGTHSDTEPERTGHAEYRWSVLAFLRCRHQLASAWYSLSPRRLEVAARCQPRRCARHRARRSWSLAGSSGNGIDARGVGAGLQPPRLADARRRCAKLEPPGHRPALVRTLIIE